MTDSESGPEPKVALATPVMRTPREWAERKGHVKPAPSPALDELKHPHYAYAEQLHGWVRDAYAYQAEHQRFRLTEQDYDAAIAASASYPQVPRHEPAVPKR